MQYVIWQFQRTRRAAFRALDPGEGWPVQSETSVVSEDTWWLVVVVCSEGPQAPYLVIRTVNKGATDGAEDAAADGPLQQLPFYRLRPARPPVL